MFKYFNTIILLNIYDIEYLVSYFTSKTKNLLYFFIKLNYIKYEMYMRFFQRKLFYTIEVVI